MSKRCDAGCGKWAFSKGLCKDHNITVPSNTPIKPPTVTPGNEISATEASSTARVVNEKTEATIPAVSIPAVMRNYHEVIRNQFSKELSPFLLAQNLDAFKVTWKNYCIGLHVHATMEDGNDAAIGLTRMLVKEAGLDSNAIATQSVADHLEEQKQQANFDAILNDPATSIEQLTTAYDAYVEFTLHHLKYEEENWVPIIAHKLPPPKTPFFQKHVLPAALATGDMEKFIVIAVASLSKYGSNNNPIEQGYTALRVFVHALRNWSSPEQWNTWMPLCKNTAGSEPWAAIVKMVPLMESPE